MYYGQNLEDKIISEWLNTNVAYGPENPLSLLSLGENNGIKFSNARHFIEGGFQATLVEPAPSAFIQLHDLYRNDPNVQLFNFAITDKEDTVTLYESGSHIDENDTALLSSIHQNEIQRWINTDFVPVQVKAISFEELLRRSKLKRFDYITIDIEGEELNLLPQINFTKLDTKCVCIEWNSKNFLEYQKCFDAFGFTLLHKNAENLIYVKN